MCDHHDRTVITPFQVPLPSPLTPVQILRRANRFVVEVVTDDGLKLHLHLPNSGRMSELLASGAQGLARLHGLPSRRTAGTLLLVRHEGRWVSVDAHLPNRLFVRGLASGALAPFRDFTRWRSEFVVDGARLDFLLEDSEGAHCFVETKSCNLVEHGVALFPDAPTARGTRHLEVLTSAVQRGSRAAVVWFVQRDDASLLRPNIGSDPAFAAALRTAVANGVEAYACRCHVTPEAVTALETIPVIP
jgi:sugar fermentation stimulation protein A